MTRPNLKHLKQTFALLGAASVSALMGLPVLAQSSSSGNGVLNPSPSVLNEAPYNRSQTSGTSDRCAGYVNGGVGGPTSDSSTSQSSSNQASASPRSSDDTAATGVRGSTNSNTNQFPNQSNIGGVGSQASNQSTIGSTTMNSNTTNSNTTSASNSSDNTPIGASRVYGPAGTTGRQAAVSVDAYASNQMQPSAFNDSMNSQMMNSQSMGSSMGNRADNSQFSANNRYPAVAHRSNGPAGTTGREATVNIDDFIARSQNSGQMAGNYSNTPMSSNSSNSSMSSNSMSSNSMSSNTNTASIPVECAPR